MEAFPLRPAARRATHGHRAPPTELRARLLLSVPCLRCCSHDVCGRAGRSRACSTRRWLSSRSVRGLPFLLAQAWAFVAPAIAPAERRALRPLLILAPALFAAGAAFEYFVLTPAVRFLQGFNHGAFDVLVQTRAYYRFELPRCGRPHLRHLAPPPRLRHRRPAPLVGSSMRRLTDTNARSLARPRVAPTVWSGAYYW
jgi:hypothetical protein